MKHHICLALLLTTICLCGPAHADQKQVLTIGRPTTEIKKEFERLKPIADYLAEHLAGQGITGCEVVLDGKNSIVSTSQLVNNGMLDVILETPYSSLALHKTTRVAPLLLIKREGRLEYNSYIFVRRDAGIDTLADLRGRSIAFEDPGSTSAYHLPRAFLEQQGIRLTPLANSSQQPPADKLGYTFADSELNISSWVFFGRTDAGTLSSPDWTSQDENPEAFRKEFKILAKTGMVPRMLVMVRPGLDPALVEALRQVLLAMPDSEAGRTALANYKINSFKEIDSPAEFMTTLESLLLHAEDHSTQ